MAAEEWGVAGERGAVTACESEQTAWQLAEAGGEVVYRRTFITRWPAPLLGREGRPRAHAATPGRE
jgi:hypothetical protein